MAKEPYVQAGIGMPDMPPVVYVPTTSSADPALREVEMSTLDDGRVALLVYSAIDRLFDLYSADSAWLLCNIPALQMVHDQTPYDVLFVDREFDNHGSGEVQ